MLTTLPQTRFVGLFTLANVYILCQQLQGQK